MKLTTLNEVFLSAASRGENTVALAQDGSLAWQPISGHEFASRVKALAAWLVDQGVVKGDRVALISENRWEWAVSDFAIMALGAVGVPLFPTITADVTAQQLADSGSKIVIVSTNDLAKKVASQQAKTSVQTIVSMDGGEGIAFSDVMKTPEREDFERVLKSVQPEDLATLIYTSGTTGDAKGVMLTHGNVASNLTETTGLFPFNPSDTYISFLPLSHVTARHIDYLMYAVNTVIAYVGRVERLLPAFGQVKPTIMVAVPRVYERIRHSVEQKSSASPVKAKILAWALKVGRKNHVPLLEGKTPSSLSWKIANKLVFSKVQAAFGGRVKVFVAGGAPLGIDLANWFADAGIAVLEGYGLTETSPVISVNLPGRHKIGTTGRVLPNLEARIADDGELDVRGPSIFVGYWKRPDATAEALTEDKWFHTGDIGEIDADGYLSITDRKRELVKTTNGKFIAPQLLENKLKVSSLIAQAALQGDKRKYVTVLLTPNFPVLEEKAKAAGVSTTDKSALVSDPKVVKLYEDEVNRVNGELAPFEKIKRFKLLADEWTIDSGELTPKMSLKRRVIAQKYAAEVAAMYGTDE